MRLLNKTTISKIDNKPMRDKIGAMLGKSYSQIKRDVTNNDPILTAYSVLQMLSKELGVKPEELLEP